MCGTILCCDAGLWPGAIAPNTLHCTVLPAFFFFFEFYVFASIMSTKCPSVSPASGDNKKRKAIRDAP